jgi:hypothetical protein
MNDAEAQFNSDRDPLDMVYERQGEQLGWWSALVAGGEFNYGAMFEIDTAGHARQPVCAQKLVDGGARLRPSELTR